MTWRPGPPTIEKLGQNHQVKETLERLFWAANKKEFPLLI